MISDTRREFHCRMCGECCSGNMQVFLNPRDLEKIGKFLKIDSNQRLLEEGVICLEKGQHQLLLPRIAFKKSASIRFCPFLENRIEEGGEYHGCCMLHPHKKPLVCALAPMARELDLNRDEELFYFKEPVEHCPGMESDKIYEVNSLFPQVKEELILEKQYYRKLRELLDKEIDPLTILREVFQLSPV